MPRPDLTLQLRAAIAARCPADLRQLLDDHGLVAFSAAIADCSPRLASDALSLLPPLQRGAVLRHMPSRRRAQLLRSDAAADSASLGRRPSARPCASSPSMASRLTSALTCRNPT